MENPFESIEKRLGSMESLLHRLIENAAPAAQALPEIGGMDLAMEITGLKRPSIYGLTSTKAIPHYRQGKRLYFKRSELVAWIESGRKLTTVEIVATPGKLPRRNNKRGRN